MATTKKTIVVELQLEDKGALALLGQLKGEVVKFTAERNKLQASVRKGNELTVQEQQRLGELSARIRNANVQIRELENNLSGAAAAGLRFRDKMADAAKAGLGAFGLNILSVTGAVFAFKQVVGDALNTLATFDQALAKVSALGGEYAANIGQIAEVTKTIGIQFGFTAVEAVGAVEELAKAGVSVEDIFGGALQAALSGAAAGELEVGQAAELVATSMTTFGIAGEDVVRVVDALTAGAVKAVTDVDDLGEALKFVGPVVANLGVSIEETVGSLALFSQAGVKGEQAGTGLRGVLSSLTSPSKIAAEELQKLGIIAEDGSNKLFDAQGKFAGLANTAEQLQIATKDLTDEERQASLGRIFGNQQLTAANILYKAGAKDIDAWTAAVTDSGIAAQVAADKTNNLIGDQDKLAASYDAVILNAGPVNDILRQITQSLTFQVNALLNANSGWEALGALFNTGVAGLVNARTAVEKFQQSLDPANKSLETLRGELALAEEQQRGFLDAGKSDVAAEFDPKIDGLRRLITAREALAATQKKNVEGDAAEVSGSEKSTEATVVKTKAVQELTAAQLAQIEAQKEKIALDLAAASITTSGKDVLNKPQQDLGLADNIPENDALKSEQLTADATAANIAQFALEQEAFQNLQDAKLQAVSGFASALRGIAEEGSAAAQFLFALEKAAAIAQVIVNGIREVSAITAIYPIGTPLTPFAVAAITAAKIRTAVSVATIAATAIQGFATGGVVKGEGGKVKRTDGTPIRRSNGDNVLITAKEDEVILNDGQQARAKRLYGDDIFQRLRIPGFAGGGITRGTALVNTPRVSVPGPSPGDLIGAELSAETRAISFAPMVSVVEINRVQQRTRVIEQLSTA